MICPACKTGNPADARFCITCGMRLRAESIVSSRRQSFPAYTVTTARLAAQKFNTNPHAWHVTNPIVTTMAVSFVVGFIIAVVSWMLLAATIDLPAGKTPPGGSLGFGFSTGMNYTRKAWYGVLGAASGFLGWFAFLLVTSWLF